MSVIVAYDFQAAPGPQHYNRVRDVFEKLNWEHVGGSTYRYPKTVPAAGEDWLNEVIPALMFFRSYVARHNLTLSKWVISAQSDLALHGNVAAPLIAPNAQHPISTTTLNRHQVNPARLRQWLGDCMQAAP